MQPTSVKRSVNCLLSGKFPQIAFDEKGLCNFCRKDSTYTLLPAVKKYGLKVLALTLDNGFISDTAYPHNVNPLCMEEISEDEILREVGVMDRFRIRPEELDPIKQKAFQQDTL